MAFWLVKSEPSSWSWDQQVAKGAKGEAWTGVRNFTARQNLVKMKKGDSAFFYHSNEGKEIVGIAEVIKEAYPDPSDKTGARPATAAMSVLGPGTVPTRQLPTVATPPLLLTALAPVMLPPPDPGENVTGTPATGLLNPSRTITEGATATSPPTTAVWPSPPLAPSAAAGPARAVAVNLADPGPLSAVTVTSCAEPAPAPRTQAVSAIPSLPDWTRPFEREPVPWVTLNRTGALAIAAPSRSSIFTRREIGSAVPTVPVCRSPATLTGATGIWLTWTSNEAWSVPAVAVIVAGPAAVAVSTTEPPITAGRAPSLGTLGGDAAAVTMTLPELDAQETGTATISWPF